LVASKELREDSLQAHSFPNSVSQQLWLQPSDRNKASEFFSLIAPGINENEFFSHALGQHTLHYRPKRKSPMLSAFHLDESNEGQEPNSLFATAIQRKNGIEVAENGVMKSLPKGSTAQDVARIVLDGGAVVVHTVDSDVGVGEARSSARSALGSAVSANLYVGGPGSVALNPHTDRWDTLIVQIQGVKEWTLCVPLPELKASDSIRCEAAEALRDQTEGCTQYGGPDWIDGKGTSSAQCKQVVTHPGDFLYMPKGVIHAAKEGSGDGVSAHLTIGLQRTGIAFEDLERSVMKAAMVTKGDDNMPRSRADTFLRIFQKAANKAASGVDGIGWRRLLPMHGLGQLKEIMTNGDSKASVDAIQLPEFNKMLQYHHFLMDDLRKETDDLVVEITAHNEFSSRAKNSYAQVSDAVMETRKTANALIERLRDPRALLAGLRNFFAHADRTVEAQETLAAQPPKKATSIPMSNPAFRPGSMSPYELIHMSRMEPVLAADVARFDTPIQRRRRLSSSCSDACSDSLSACNAICALEPKLCGCDGAPCYSSCDGGCVTGCDNNCLTGCDGNCLTGCDSGGVCSSSCDSGCVGGCDSGCVGGCDKWGVKSCDKHCTSSCDNTCSSSCDGSCSGLSSCDTGCTDSCDSGCTSSCDEGCVTSCDADCTTSCDDACGDCESTCTTVYNACMDSCTSFSDVWDQVVDLGETVAALAVELAELIASCFSSQGSWPSLNDMKKFATCSALSFAPTASIFPAAELMSSVLSDPDGILDLPQILTD